jgi:hypothetical protein
MTKADAILWKFAEPHFDAVVNPERLEESRNVLRAELSSQIRSQQVTFWICCGMVLLLFIGSFVLVLLHLGEPSFVTVVFGVTGISFTALIRQMIALWRESSRMTLIQRLADSLPAKDLKAIILVLLNPK